MKDGRKEVLVVDDDPDVLRSFMRLLASHAEVKVALGAEAAMAVLASKHFDTVVCDFNMAGPHGGWLLRQVRDKYPHMDRILLSGSSYSDLSRYLEPGLVDRFLEKPLELDDLIAAIR
jgi:DNA-binding NtrC family response regulator